MRYTRTQVKSAGLHSYRLRSENSPGSTTFTDRVLVNSIVRLDNSDNDVLLVGPSSGGHLAGVLAWQPHPPPEKQAFHDAWPVGIAAQPHGLPKMPAFLVYLRDALDAGAMPEVLSPVPHQDRWLAGRDFEDFAAWGRATALREGALFIDLTMIVTDTYRGMGAAAVEALFTDARTHTDDAGARLNADGVVRGLRQLPQALLAPYLRPET